jgi:PPOX class probable F420-dependent enzyme
MEESEARAFVARHHAAVLATLKRDGRPQLSNISYSLDDDGRIKISTTVDRAKTRNLRRDPRVSLAVQGDNWHEYLVVEGRAEIVEGDVLGDLRRVYERTRGEPHPNWEEFAAAMIRDRRLILAITIERFYPLERTRQR